MRINEGGSGGFGGDIDGIGRLVRGFGGVGLGWFMIIRIGIYWIRGFAGLGMPVVGVERRDGVGRLVVRW